MKHIGSWLAAVLLAGCATPHLAGQWQAKWPDGHLTTLSVQDFGEGQWYLKGSPLELGGVYAVDQDRLICTRPDTPRVGFVWRIVDDRHLLLVGQPPPDRLGDRWLGLELTRVPPPRPPEEQTEESGDDDSALPKHPPPDPPPVDKP